MLPVETPLAGRIPPEKFAPGERGQTLNPADRQASAEDDFGRIMDRTQPSEIPPKRHHHNDRMAGAMRNPKPDKAELNADEAATERAAFSKTDEAVSKNFDQQNKTEVCPETNPAKTTGNEESTPVLIAPTPPPVFVTLPRMSSFSGVTETAPANESDLLAQPLPAPVSITAGAMPEDAGRKVETIALNLVDLNPSPSAGVIEGRSVGKNAAEKKSTALTTEAVIQPKIITALQPSADSSASAGSIQLPASSDNNPPTTTSEPDTAGEILPTTISPIATGKNLSNNSGTGVATDAGAMKKAEKQTEVAGLDAKVLPGGKVDQSHAPQLRTVAASAANSDHLQSDVSISLSATNLTSPVLTETPEALALPSLAETQLRTVERTAEMMSAHVMRLAKTDHESMQVVIRPGAGTELSLELRQRNGEVEVHAVLQRGDYQALNQHWPELQERLEQRGIKLAPLGGETDYSFTGNGSFSQQQNSHREEVAQQASAFAEFTLAMNRGGATARRATAVPGANEWWA